MFFGEMSFLEGVFRGDVQDPLTSAPPKSVHANLNDMNAIDKYLLFTFANRLKICDHISNLKFVLPV